MKHLKCLAKYNLENPNYHSQLNDPRWKKLQQKILRAADFQCTLCGSENNLQVHHIRYGKTAWDVDDDDLVALCYGCHMTVHRKNITIVWEPPNSYFDGERLANPYLSQEDVDRLSIDEAAMAYLEINGNSELGYFICDQRAWDPDMAEEYEYKISGYPEDYYG